MQQFKSSNEGKSNKYFIVIQRTQFKIPNQVNQINIFYSNC